MRLLPKPDGDAHPIAERANSTVMIEAGCEELADLGRILSAGVNADPAISEVPPARARELAAKISGIAAAAEGSASFMLTLMDLLEIDRVVSAVSVLGNDPHFPSLEEMGEDAVDRIALEVQQMHDEARAGGAA